MRGRARVRQVVLTVLLAGFAQLGLAQNASGDAASRPDVVAAGKVELVEGDVRFIDTSGNVRRPRVGDEINEGESILTGADGEVHLNMEDGGYIGVRPNTKMRIVNYRAEGDDDDRSVLNLVEGSFRAVTGWIGKLGLQHYVVNTPTVTIGVRGTEHEPLVIPEGSAVGDPGTYDRVYAGETVIQTPQGSINVRPNQAGFAPRRGTLRPRLLARVPAFFRATRNERRFDGLHARIQQRLQQRRELRRKFIQERRARVGERRQGQKATVRDALERRREGKAATIHGRQAQRREQLQQRREERERLRRERAEKAQHPRAQLRERREGVEGEGPDLPQREFEERRGPRRRQ